MKNFLQSYLKKTVISAVAESTAAKSVAKKAVEYQQAVRTSSAAGTFNRWLSALAEESKAELHRKIHGKGSNKASSMGSAPEQLGKTSCSSSNTR